MLDKDTIAEAFAQLGVDLLFKQEIAERSDVVGIMETIVFFMPKPYRELSAYVTQSHLTIIVEDEGGVHRATYGLKISSEASLEALVESIAKEHELLATLKGASVTDTPIDWREYK